MAYLVTHSLSKRFDNNKCKWALPKIIVVVPDADLLQVFNREKNYGSHGAVTKPFATILNYIMTAHERDLAAFKEHLPAKSICDGYPHILWVQPPQHENFPDNSL